MVNKDNILVEEKKNKLIELTVGFSEHYLNKEYEYVKC